MPNILIVCGAQKTYISEGQYNRSLVAMHKAQQYIGMEPLPSYTVNNIIGDPDFENQCARFDQHLEDVFGS